MMKRQKHGSKPLAPTDAATMSRSSPHSSIRDTEMFLHLAEMFDNLTLDQIEAILLASPSSSLQTLIDHCIDASATGTSAGNDSESKREGSDGMSEAYEMVPLMPATTFDTDQPQSLSQSTEHRQRVGAALSTLFTNMSTSSLTFEQQHKALQTLSKIIDNLLSHPTTEKYRVLPLTNLAFRAKVLAVNGSLEVLKSVGFIEVEGGNILMLEGETIEILDYCLSVIKDKCKELERKLPATDVRENSIYQSKRDWKQPSPASAAPSPLLSVRLTREQLADIAEHRLKPSATPAPQLPSSVYTVQRRGRIMNLHAQQQYRQELALMRSEKKSQWLTSAAGRKRVMTVSDIEAMRQAELDAHAKFGTGMLSDSAYVEIGKEALRLTNEFRANEGIDDSPIQWHQQIAEIGWVHSRNMGDGAATFSHDGFNDRVRQYPMPHRGAGENLFMAHGVAAAVIAKAAVDGWIHSPGHRKNLLGRWNYCGIGVFRSSQGAFYLTQLFALA